jgi:DNA-binding NtrC family response regulator
VKKEPILWIIDSEQWPRACLRAELIERDYNPYGFIKIQDAFGALSKGTAAKPEALVLELRNQNLSEGSVGKIRELGVPVILLGGNPELNDPVISHHQWKLVLKRPFTLGTVADLVEKVLAADYAD